MLHAHRKPGIKYATPDAWQSTDQPFLAKLPWKWSLRKHQFIDCIEPELFHQYQFQMTDGHNNNIAK